MDEARSVAPSKLKQDRVAKRFLVEWPDGLKVSFPWVFLREHCPSAGERVLREGQPSEPLGILKAVPSTEIADTKMVGSYAVSFIWTDGHSAGIYTWEYLRKLAESYQDLGNAPT